jgi:glycosyltransferase involved in cell wall biosynthesis
MRKTILVLSTDLKLLHKDSEVFQRFQQYASGEFNVLVAILGTSKIVQNYTSEKLKIDYFQSSRTPWGFKILYTRLQQHYSHPVDLVTCQDPFVMGFLGVCLKKILRIPKLELQLHGDFLSHAWLIEKWINPIYWILMHWNLTQADQIRLVLKRQEKYFKAHFQNSKVYTLPILGVDQLSPTVSNFDLRKAFAIPPTAPVALMVGRLVGVKNFEVVIKSLAQYCQNSLDSFHLIIVGDGPLRTKLEKLANNLKISDLIHFAGWQNQLRNYYEQSDFLIVNSSYEGWGRVIIEAMLCAKPVISTPVGCALDLVANQETGLLVQKSGQNGLLDVLQNWFLCKSEWAKMGEKAQELCQSYIAQWQPAYRKQWDAWL